MLYWDYKQRNVMKKNIIITVTILAAVAAIAALAYFSYTIEYRVIENTELCEDGVCRLTETTVKYINKDGIAIKLRLN